MYRTLPSFDGLLWNAVCDVHNEWKCEKMQKVKLGGDMQKPEGQGIIIYLDPRVLFWHNRHTLKIAFEKIGVRVMSIWWRRGELNPCPKAHSQEFLRAQFVYWHSCHSTPTNRLTAFVESFYMTSATLNPYTFTANRRHTSEPRYFRRWRASRN